MRELSSYSPEQIDQFIANHEAKGLERTDAYAALLGERARRRHPALGLDIHKSLDLLKKKARLQEFCSYGELAEASGVAWSHTVRARMSGPRSHLDSLLDFCRHAGLPLLTALVVNKQNLATGHLDGFSLDGFVASARRIGRSVEDGESFLLACQEACFAWGRSQQQADA